MLGEEICTEDPIHINCSEQFNPLDSHGKVQLEVTTELLRDMQKVGYIMGQHFNMMPSTNVGIATMGHMSCRIGRHYVLSGKSYDNASTLVMFM